MTRAWPPASSKLSADELVLQLLDLVGGLRGEGVHVQEDPLPGHVPVVVDRDGDFGDEIAVRIQLPDQSVCFGFHFRLIVAVDGDLHRGYQVCSGYRPPSSHRSRFWRHSPWGGYPRRSSQPHVEHGGDGDEKDADAEKQADNGELHGGRVTQSRSRALPVAGCSRR